MRPRHKSPPLPFLRSLLLAIILTAPVLSAAQVIYRCEQNGRITYTDSPCDQPLIRDGTARERHPSAAPSRAVVGGGYENPYGPWRGQAQFQVTNVGMRTDKTHQVVPLILDVAEDGKVAGTSQENGCRMLGIASSSHTPRMLNLDVTLSRCEANEMNQRYHGSLLINTSDRSARLNLNAQRIGLGAGVVADVKATLRR